MAAATTKQQRKGIRERFNEFIESIIDTAERGRHSSLRMPGTRQEIEEYERVGGEARLEREHEEVRRAVPERTEQIELREGMTRQGLDVATRLASAFIKIERGSDFGQEISAWIARG